MKITKQRLKEIIKEELSRVLNEITPEEQAQWAQLKDDAIPRRIPIMYLARHDLAHPPVPQGVKDRMTAQDDQRDEHVLKSVIAAYEEETNQKAEKDLDAFVEWSFQHLGRPGSSQEHGRGVANMWKENLVNVRRWFEHKYGQPAQN